MFVKLLKNKWTIFAVITAVGLGLDLLTKFFAATSLQGRPVRIVGHYLQFMLVYNKAALFGIDPRHFLPAFPLNTFFFAFSILAIVVIFFYYNSLRDNDMLMRYGLALILPGALGNLFDRIVHPNLGVVDFIRVGISDTVYWPIFNLADVYVTIGVIAIFINFLREERVRKAKESAAA